MKEIVVHHNGQIKKIVAEDNSMLLSVLRENKYEVWAPCGGSGTCGKCKVNVKGEGSVTSCMYPVSENIEVFLPDRSEAKVLEAQHEFTHTIPFSPGKEAMLSHYPFGVAIDIGTTTLVFYLINMVSGTLMETRSRMNPQAKYGGDVISRIEYCGKNETGLQQLQNEIVSVIDEELQHFANISGITANELVKVNIVGNTTMLHLLLGVDPKPLALAPYTPVFTEKKYLKGQELFKNTHPDAEIILLPSISAYVGADIVSGLASIHPPENIKNYLLVDIGTNGEMALITPEKIYCCSTAAGPAFEGANISCGMGAFNGAISFYDGNKMRTIGNDPAKGICGSGLIDIVAHCLDTGKVTMEGNMESDFILAKSNESGNEDVVLTPQDIREVQLAKSAIVSGIKILMQSAGLSYDDLDALFLAGGFGNYIRIESAMRIGLIPPEFEGKIIPIGNSSGTGATLACKSDAFMEHVDAIVERTEYVELATHPDFTLEYAMNMFFY